MHWLRRYNLVGLYGREAGHTSSQLGEAAWDRKREHCEAALDTLKVMVRSTRETTEENVDTDCDLCGAGAGAGADGAEGAADVGAPPANRDGCTGRVVCRAGVLLLGPQLRLARGGDRAAAKRDLMKGAVTLKVAVQVLQQHRAVVHRTEAVEKSCHERPLPS